MINLISVIPTDRFVFLQEIANMTNDKKNTIKVQLNRLVKQGRIERLDIVKDIMDERYSKGTRAKTRYMYKAKQ